MLETLNREAQVKEIISTDKIKFYQKLQEILIITSQYQRMKGNNSIIYFQV
jgi:hypothetical protein